MDDLELTTDEVQRILWACAHINIVSCTPPYLQDFLAYRLDEAAPEVAVKVRRLTPAEMDRLCHLILEQKGQRERQ